MTRIRRRKPKFEFAQLLNAVLRDYRVSWRARGLLAELLSYPPDYEISVDELVKRAKLQGGNVEGREAMRTAARELKAVGYIVETRYQDAQGRWRTDLEVTDDPMYELLLSPAHTDDGFSGVGSPGVGFSGVSPNTEKNTEKNTSPPTPPSPVEGATTRTDDGPGGEDESSTPTNDSGTLARAESLVDSAVRCWRSHHRAPTPRDRRRLAKRVRAELEAGGDETVILDELTRDLSDVQSAVSVVMGARTSTPGWGRVVDPRPDVSQYTVTGPRPPWCGRCDERTRHVVVRAASGRESFARCECHPERAEEVPPDTEEPPSVEELTADLEAEPAPTKARRSGLSDGAATAAKQARRRLAELLGSNK